MLESVIGRTYGPIEITVSPDKVAEYVAATGDASSRWVEHAPPSYAGALLFVVAPVFLADPDVVPHAAMVIHGEQTFHWHRPFEIGTVLRLSGTLERVRERNGVAFANFGVTIASEHGDVVTGGSTFLMSGDAPPGGNAAERPEPAPTARAASDTPDLETAPDGELPPMSKSASRADLVRYAGASGDFNPIHWDHGLAFEAGLGGVVGHGLLVAAWATQAAARMTFGPAPVESARIRFRNPYYPADQAIVTGTVEGSKVSVGVHTGEVEHVAATFTLAGAVTP